MNTQDKLKSLPVPTIISIEGSTDIKFVDLVFPDAITRTKVTQTNNGFYIYINVVGLTEKIDYTYEGKRVRVLSDEEVSELTDVGVVVSDNDKIDSETKYFVIGQLSYFDPCKKADGMFKKDLIGFDELIEEDIGLE